ncbi:MAG: hypothetical protein V4757_07060 [Pseudomonadota bacterium]
MKELRQAWRQLGRDFRGPAWAFLNAARAALKTDVLNKLAARKQRSKLGRKGLIWSQRAHGVAVGLFWYVVLQGAAGVLAVLLPISLALLVAGMYWAGAGDDT